VNDSPVDCQSRDRAARRRLATKVTERVNTLSGFAMLSHLPHRGRQGTFRKEPVGDGFSAPVILGQNRIARGDRLAPPMGELSPQVTERANTLSGLVNSATSPKGRGKASFEIEHRGRCMLRPIRYGLCKNP